MRLPDSVMEIAEVIGRERALFLLGQLPRCYVKDSRRADTAKGWRSERVMLYVPKTLKPDHYLVQILGWHDAQRMVQAFGGEVLCPANCRTVYQPHRDQGIRRMHGDGVPITMIAQWFGMTERRVRQVLEIPQEATTSTNGHNRANSTNKGRAAA